MSDSICIIDFNGRAGPYDVGYWADWYPDKQHVVFGGCWQHIPMMFASQQPTEEECLAWLQLHDSRSTEDMARGWVVVTEELDFLWSTIRAYKPHRELAPKEMTKQEWEDYQDGWDDGVYFVFNSIMRNRMRRQGG